MSKTGEYHSFAGAKARCNNRKHPKYKDYGGRGIKFLFKSFEQWFSEVGPKPSPKHSLDRYPNNDGNYEPGNVRWATQSEQRNNCREKAFPNHRDRFGRYTKNLTLESVTEGLWEALKQECCKVPDEAKMIVFLTKEKFHKALIRAYEGV
jgi:hypothetical protein